MPEGFRDVGGGMGGFLPIGGGGLGFESGIFGDECVLVGLRLLLSAATDGGAAGVALGGIGGAAPGRGGGGTAGALLPGLDEFCFLEFVSGSES